MSYKEWLLAELENDGYIDSVEMDILEIDRDYLLQCTEVVEADLDNYEAQFAEHCKNRGATPIWDF